MSEIKTFNFTPISNERQQVHTISFSERIRRGKEGVLKPHRTNFYILLFVTEGSSHHLIDFKIHKIDKGDFFIIRPGQVHAFFQSKDLDGTIIAFTEEFLLNKSHYSFFSENSRLLKELSFGSPFHLHCDQEKINVLTQMIQQELANVYNELQENILQNQISSLILYLLRIKRGSQNLSPKKSKESLYASQFKSLIERFHGKQYTVTQYANELGISVRSLQKISELHLGKQPKTVIQECLLLESKRMLVNPMLLVKEIAYDLGFREPTNFTKFFKKFAKMSPEQFRKSLSD
ncbi:helix-turn-helix domain-containing protein [Pedobacter psychrodurus]|uniref:Helix-turn-helix domain-containing protein n=1 Tax=Pedobacter psychrodurus TaxID=2530456 RepID=A0A4R0Q6A0_9SPHI|nr:helix-turn-helix domain-containing protein [Pedobacter psychrodurus]TCD28709.1 helix-turn-helix domain-containing protein [Pedobacter psychrodurus]